MNWHPPLGTTLTTLLVLAALAAMIASFTWSRKLLDPSSPAGLLSLGLRGLAFVLLLFFLLQPTSLPPPQKIQVKRTIAILFDTSASMSKPGAGEVSQSMAVNPTATQPATAPAAADGSRLQQARESLQQSQLIARINEQAQVALHRFDAAAAPVAVDALAALQAQGRSTDLSAALDQVVKQHENDDLTAIMIFTDGRVTAGADPLETAKRLKIPIFPVAMGRESLATPERAPDRFDLSVEGVAADTRVILGRTVQVVATIINDNFPAQQVTVELLEHEQPMHTTAVQISPQQPRRQALFTLKPATLGKHTYQVRLPTLSEDVNPANNLASFTVEVVDPVNRLLYLDRLRQERRFLRPVLEASKNVRYTTVVQQDQNRVLVDGNDPQMKRDAANFSSDQLAGLKALILGDLPQTALTDAQIQSLSQWVDQGGALLLMAGPSSVGPKGFAGTPLASLLPVDLPETMRYVEDELVVGLTAEGVAHPAFQKVQATWAHTAPLLSHFEIASVRPAATVLVASTDARQLPIVVSQNRGRGKVAIVLSDSTWRWQLGFDSDQAAAGTVSPHAVFWRQIIDWLLPSLDDDDQALTTVQLIADRSDYQLGDQVTLITAVRDAQGNVIEGAEVSLTAATPDGRPLLREARFEASESGGVYLAQFEAYAAGDYEVTVTARQGTTTLGTDRIGFKVTQPLLEFANTEPDRELLRQLATLTGGEYLEAAMLNRVLSLAKLEPREVELQPNAATDARSAWDRWWLMALFITLMSAEWFVRRKNQWV